MNENEQVDKFCPVMTDWAELIRYKHTITDIFILISLTLVYDPITSNFHIEITILRTEENVQTQELWNKIFIGCMWLIAQWAYWASTFIFRPKSNRTWICRPGPFWMFTNVYNMYNLVGRHLTRPYYMSILNDEISSCTN